MAVNLLSVVLRFLSSSFRGLSLFSRFYFTTWPMFHFVELIFPVGIRFDQLLRSFNIHVEGKVTPSQQPICCYRSFSLQKQNENKAFAKAWQLVYQGVSRHLLLLNLLVLHYTVNDFLKLESTFEFFINSEIF